MSHHWNVSPGYRTCPGRIVIFYKVDLPLNLWTYVGLVVDLLYLSLVLFVSQILPILSIYYFLFVHFSSHDVLLFSLAKKTTVRGGTTTNQNKVNVKRRIRLLVRLVLMIYTINYFGFVLVLWQIVMVVASG